MTVATYVDRLSLRFAPNIREELLTEVLFRQEAKKRKLTVRTRTGYYTAPVTPQE